jgi:hypothetical protein
MSDENIIRFLEEIGRGKGIVMLVGDPHDENNATIINGLIQSYSFEIQDNTMEVGWHGGPSHRVATREPEVIMDIQVRIVDRVAFKKKDVAKEVGISNNSQLAKRTMML